MNETQERELTIGDILRIFKRRIRWFLIIFIVITIGAAGYTFLLDKTYSATAVIESKSQSSMSAFSSLGGLASLAGVSSSSLTNKNAVEYERMKSDYVLNKIIDELKLSDKIKIEKKDKSPEKIKKGIRKTLYESISINESKDNGLISINVKFDDPETASEIANAVFRYYLELDKNNNTKKYDEFLSKYNETFQTVSKQYDEINKKVIDYELKNKVSSDFNSMSSIFQSYTENYSALMNIDNTKEELQSQINSFENQYLNVDPKIKEMLSSNNNRALSDLKSQIINLNIQLESTKINEPNSPKINDLMAQIAVLQNNYNKILKEILSNNDLYLSNASPAALQKYLELKTQYENLDMLKEKSTEMVKKFDSELMTKSPVLYEYFIMKKDQKIIQTQYEYLKNAMEQARLSNITYEPKFTKYKDAEPEEIPVAPNKKMIVAIGGVLGIFFGILVVFMIDAIDKKVKDAYEFEAFYGIPEIKIKNREELEKIVKYAYKSNINKLILLDMSKTEISNEMCKIFIDFDSKIKTYKSDEKKDLRKSVEEFENFKNDEKAIAVFKNSDDSDFMMYKDYAEKTIILIQAGKTCHEELTEMYKTVKDPVNILFF